MKKLLLFVSSLFIAVAMMAQYNVTIKVDVSSIEGFNADTTDVYVSGDFAGWAEPGTDSAYLMTAETATVYAITIEFPDGENEANFKFFLVYNNEHSWTYGEWDGDPNRFLALIGESTWEFPWAIKPFWVTFNVDMMYAPAFSADTTDVYLAGNIASSWAQPGTIEYFKMTPTKDGIYTKSMLVYPDEAQYKYFFVNNGVPSWEYGEWTGDPNRVVVFDTAATVNDYFGTLEGISEHGIDAIESIYPNPCNSYVNIVLTSDINQVNSIQVFNILGEIVYTLEDISVQKEVNIFTGDLTSGVYFVTVTNDQGYQAARFIKK